MVEVELHDEVADWMDSLDDVEWMRTVVVIDRLVALGSLARMPLSKSLGDGLFELRFTLGPTARRITYRFTNVRSGQSTRQRNSGRDVVAPPWSCHDRPVKRANETHNDRPTHVGSRVEP
ncbi:type II toxin-antitoxin system RelE/ParE family toxin [Candidatus Binatia bacterium]|nr:type II toxin-antitoxin system RelE/ParE family toxin [Candidatus Binatia bacterium]